MAAAAGDLEPPRGDAKHRKRRDGLVADWAGEGLERLRGPLGIASKTARPSWKRSGEDGQGERANPAGLITSYPKCRTCCERIGHQCTSVSTSLTSSGLYSKGREPSCKAVEIRPARSGPPAASRRTRLAGMLGSPQRSGTSCPSRGTRPATVDGESPGKPHVLQRRRHPTGGERSRSPNRGTWPRSRRDTGRERRNFLRVPQTSSCSSSKSPRTRPGRSPRLPDSSRGPRESCRRRRPEPRAERRRGDTQAMEQMLAALLPATTSAAEGASRGRRPPGSPESKNAPLFPYYQGMPTTAALAARGTGTRPAAESTAADKGLPPTRSRKGLALSLTGELT